MVLESYVFDQTSLSPFIADCVNISAGRGDFARGLWNQIGFELRYGCDRLRVLPEAGAFLISRMTRRGDSRCSGSI